MASDLGLKLKKIYHDTYDFINEKWVITHDEESAPRLQRFAHFWLLVFKSFAKNKGPLRATALAYTTLLGLVPVLAVGFSIATSLLQHQDEAARTKIFQQVIDAAVPQLKTLTAENGRPLAENPRDQIAKYLNSFIDNAQSKTLGISGILGFVVVAVLLLSTIEDTFNDIWGVTRGRSWFRRFVQYWTTISLGPVVLAVIITFLSKYTFRGLEPTTPIMADIAKWIISFIVVSVAFGLFYKLMPNTEVQWRAALFAGAVGGALWLLMNALSRYQGSKVIEMSKIYGTLSLIPIFLLGLYFSWLILLFGAQVSYALQNRKMYLQERKAESVNQRGREYVALRMMTYIAQRFDHGQRPATVLELGTMLGVPSRLIGRVLQPLLQAGLVLEVTSGNEASYAPARPLESITCHDVLVAMRIVGGQELLTRDEPTRSLVNAEFERINNAEKQAACATTLRQLIDRIPYVEAHHNPAVVEEIYKQAGIAS
jgi:membrane protein